MEWGMLADIAICAGVTGAQIPRSGDTGIREVSSRILFCTAGLASMTALVTQGVPSHEILLLPVYVYFSLPCRVHRLACQRWCSSRPIVGAPRGSLAHGRWA